MGHELNDTEGIRAPGEKIPSHIQAELSRIYTRMRLVQEENVTGTLEVKASLVSPQGHFLHGDGLAPCGQLPAGDVLLGAVPVPSYQHRQSRRRYENLQGLVQSGRHCVPHPSRSSPLSIGRHGPGYTVGLVSLASGGLWRIYSFIERAQVTSNARQALSCRTHLLEQTVPKDSPGRSAGRLPKPAPAVPERTRSLMSGHCTSQAIPIPH